MEFTRQQRNQVYRMALDIFNSGVGERYLCDLISRVASELLNLSGWRSLSDKFPEFQAQRPDDATFLWWSEGDYLSRIECLQKCIKLTE